MYVPLPCLVPSTKSILVNLDQWKHKVGQGLASIITAESRPGMGQGPELPFTYFGHCLVQFNSSFIFLIGGRNNYNNFRSNVLTYDAKHNSWNSIKTNTMPCEPWSLGYQTTCTLLVICNPLQLKWGRKNCTY